MIRRRTAVRAVAAVAVAAMSTVGLVAAAGPAGAAVLCRTATAPTTSWDIYWNAEDEGIWRSALFRTSNCDEHRILWGGFANTAWDAADVRTVTYRDDRTTPITYSSWVRVRNDDFTVIRRGVDANRLVQFRVRAVREAYQTGMHPPDPVGTGLNF